MAESDAKVDHEHIRVAEAAMGDFQQNIVRPKYGDFDRDVLDFAVYFAEDLVHSVSGGSLRGHLVSIFVNG